MNAANMMAPFAGSVLCMEDTVLDAVRLLEARGLAMAPVVDKQGVVLGVVTAGGLLESLLPDNDGNVRGAIDSAGALMDAKVGLVLETGYASVLPETGVFDVAAFFRAVKGPLAVLVVDDSKRLLGIITQKEVIKRLCEYAQRRR